MLSLMVAHGVMDAGPFVVALSIVFVAGVVVRRVVPAHGRLLVVAAGGLGFQVVHVAEHVAQVAYWLAHPTEAPWLTPWAETGVHVFAALSDGRHGTGQELLHLVGNVIFLGGVVAALALAARLSPSGRRVLHLALWVQAAHVGEHVLLTSTWLATGEAVGVTTAFGALTADPVTGGAVRVWVHFALNLAATVPALWGAVLVCRRTKGAAPRRGRGGRRRPAPSVDHPVGAPRGRSPEPSLDDLAGEPEVAGSPPL